MRTALPHFPIGRFADEQRPHAFWHTVACFHFLFLLYPFSLKGNESINQALYFREEMMHLFMLAALISDCAGSLAGRLAGCLAFAAAAFFHCILQSFCLQCFYMFHETNSFPDFRSRKYTIHQKRTQFPFSFRLPPFLFENKPFLQPYPAF